MIQSLFIGRFQPLHRAHFEDIQSIIARGEKCIIAIVASNKYHTLDNPLTCAERREIIESVLDAENIHKKYYDIVEVTDIDNDEKWVEHVEKHIPKCTKVYSGSDWTLRLFAEKKTYEVIPITLLRDSHGQIISATLIRDLIVKDAPLDQYLHAKTIELIARFGLRNRLENLVF